MKNFRILAKMFLIIALGLFVLAIPLWFLCTTDNGMIAGTEFYDMKRPVCFANNFDVDSRGNVYFAIGGSMTIQVYSNNNQYKFTLPLRKNSIGGTEFFVNIKENDNIEVFLVRSQAVFEFNQKGELIGENNNAEYYKKNLPESIASGSFKLKKAGVVYTVEPHSSFFYLIKKTTGNVSEVIFKIPADQIWFVAVRAAAVGMLVAFILLNVINNRMAYRALTMRR